MDAVLVDQLRVVLAGLWLFFFAEVGIQSTIIICTSTLMSVSHAYCPVALLGTNVLEGWDDHQWRGYCVLIHFSATCGLGMRASPLKESDHDHF